MKVDNTKQIVLDLKLKHPKHYNRMIKKHYPEIWNNIEMFNNHIECDYTMNVPQKIYNWLYDINKVPRCPVKGNHLKFHNAKFEYRKFDGRGVFTKEFALERAKNHIHVTAKKPDYMSVEVRPHTFNELVDLYTKYDLYNIDSNKASQHLTWRYPELKKAIHQYYGLDKNWWHCHKWIRNKVETIEGKVVGYDGSIKQYSNLNDFKRQNRKNRIENAELLSKEETIRRLNDFIKTQKHFHNIYQNLASYQPELVKSVEYYTKHIDVEKFTERAYIILYGECKLEEQYTHSDFISFVHGYDKHAYKGTYTSSGEQELKLFIQSLGYDVSKTKINKSEIDLFIKDKNIGFEYNGIYWHSNARVDKLYHINKSKLAESNNIKLYHIFEDDWNVHKDVVKNLIKQKLNIYNNVIDINKCKIKLNVDHDIVNKFITQHDLHIPEFHHDNVCAFYNDKLIYCITFLTIEPYKIMKISNMCGEFDVKFVNIEKLLQLYIDNRPFITQIYARADICTYNKSELLYENFNMHYFQQNGPKPYFINPSKSLQRYNMDLYKTLIEEEFSIIDAKYLDVEDYMKQKGYLTIYDCGGYIYKWERK